ncbi:MAG: hypothetical protein ACRENB_06610 [Gemmatimonadales bacterium]
MRGYWWKIGLGAAMVFALGLTVVSVVNAGKSRVKSMLATAGGRLPVRITDLPFRLEGRHIGDLSGVEVRRQSAGEVGEVVIRVELSDAAYLPELAACDVAAGRVHHWKRSPRFRCADAAEIATGELGRLGDIVFEPGGLRRPIYLDARDLDRWKRSDVRALDANLVRVGDGIRASGRFDLMPDHGRPERGTFDLVAGDGGARFVVRDERGREIVNFSAGDHGLNIKF